MTIKNTADELEIAAQEFLDLIEGEVITSEKYSSATLPNPKDMAYAQSFLSYSSKAINLRRKIREYKEFKERQPTETISLDSLLLANLRKEYERGRKADSCFPRYSGTFENFVQECLKDYFLVSNS